MHSDLFKYSLMCIFRTIYEHLEHVYSDQLYVAYIVVLRMRHENWSSPIRLQTNEYYKSLI